MLVVFLQVLFIYIKGEYDEEMFNEVFMMYIFILLSYFIVVFIEIVVVMLCGNLGKRLINCLVEWVFYFCKEVQWLCEEFDSWFFDIWQLEEVDEVECWLVMLGEIWYGFVDVDDDYMFFDLVKVIILMLGMDEQGNMSEEGIFVVLVVKFFDE